MGTDLTSASAGAEGSPRMVTLHVLCPSLPPPNRFTFNDLALSATVAQLKALITQSLPTHPAAATQRLIYGGKPLTNDNATLEVVLGPGEVSTSLVVFGLVRVH